MSYNTRMVMVGGGFSGGDVSDPIGLPDGSAAAPALYFTSDDDGSGTGFYRSGANTIAATLNGSSRLLMNTNLLTWGGPSGITVSAAAAVITNSVGPLDLGTGATTGHALGSGDVLVGGKLEVDGTSYFDGAALFYTDFLAADDVEFSMGDANDCGFLWSTAQTTDAMLSFNKNNLTVFTTYNNRTKDHQAAAPADPCIYIYSRTDVASKTDEYLAIRCQPTNAVLDTGAASHNMQFHIGGSQVAQFNQNGLLFQSTGDYIQWLTTGIWSSPTDGYLKIENAARTASMILDAGNKYLYLDGADTNTYLHAKAADTIGMTCLGLATHEWDWDSYDISASRTGVPVHLKVENEETANSLSSAYMHIKTGGASAGDPFLWFQIDGVQNWSVGIDNSNNDAFTICETGDLTANHVLAINPSTYQTTLYGDLSIPNGDKLYLDGGSDTYITHDNSNRISMFCGGGRTAMFETTHLDMTAKYIEFNEMTAPGNGDANTARLYAVDNGSGKTQLCVVFRSGAVQVLATEP